MFYLLKNSYSMCNWAGKSRVTFLKSDVSLVCSCRHRSRKTHWAFDCISMILPVFFFSSSNSILLLEQPATIYKTCSPSKVVILQNEWVLINSGVKWLVKANFFARTVCMSISQGPPVSFLSNECHWLWFCFLQKCSFVSVVC